jgi:hypothetical protein
MWISTAERAGALVCSEHNNCACPQRMAVAWETRVAPFSLAGAGKCRARAIHEISPKSDFHYPALRRRGGPNQVASESRIPIG